MRIVATYVGGPTALLEVDGVSVITDPTFDPAPHDYRPGPYTLRKLAGPSIGPDSIDGVDAVLLSHDHHLDNLDTTGRAFLERASIVLTTSAGAKRYATQWASSLGRRGPSRIPKGGHFKSQQFPRNMGPQRPSAGP